MNERMDEWTFEIFTQFVLLSQLARIQTDSVAEKLKELYADIHLEIGENGPFIWSVFKYNYSDLISEPVRFPSEILIDLGLKVLLLRL